jgi:midasin (ATPase involved in ribosome maturation)
VTTAELLRSVSDHIEEKLLYRLKESLYFSILSDESTDIASKELSICGRWLEMGKPVEHFWGMVHVKEVDAKSITEALLHFLHTKGIDLKKLRGLGFDGASTMSGCRSGI